MCTWRAFCIPEARQSKLVPSESVEQTYKREILMRNEVENYMFAGADAKRGVVKTKKISKYVASSSSSSSASCSPSSSSRIGLMLLRVDCNFNSNALETPKKQTTQIAFIFEDTAPIFVQ